METIFASLITQFKNPWQYICVAAIWAGFLYFAIDTKYLYPAILCSLSIAYILQTIMNECITWFKIKKLNKSILFNLLHMNEDEKKFIGYCFFNNIQTCSLSMLHQNGAVWNTLPQKGIALRPSGVVQADALPLSIPENVWKLIEKHQKEIFAEYIKDEC